MNFFFCRFFERPKTCVVWSALHKNRVSDHLILSTWPKNRSMKSSKLRSFYPCNFLVVMLPIFPLKLKVNFTLIFGAVYWKIVCSKHTTPMALGNMREFLLPMVYKTTNFIGYGISRSLSKKRTHSWFTSGSVQRWRSPTRHGWSVNRASLWLKQNLANFVFKIKQR